MSVAAFIQLLLTSEIYHGEETVMIISDLGSDLEVPGIVFRFPGGERVILFHRTSTLSSAH